MKRLIIFRHGDYDFYKNLTEISAQDLFLKARHMIEFIGRPAAIFTSPIRRAWQTANVLNLAFGNVPLIEKKELQDFSALSIPYFAKRFASEAQHDFANDNVLVWVTHEPSVQELVGITLHTAEWLVLEAPEWECIFEPKLRKVYRAFNFLTSLGYLPNEALHMLSEWTTDTLSEEETQNINLLLR